VQDKSDIRRLLRIAAGLWLAYLAVSALIDYLLKSPGPLESYLYFADTGIALFFLGLTFWPWLQARLKEGYLPIIISLICLLPVLFNQVAIYYLFRGPLPPPESMLSRVVPFLMVGLLLVAWQYRWPHTIIFTLGMALVNIVIMLVYGPAQRSSLSGGIFAVLT
jgi:hypothetical protein